MSRLKIYPEDIILLVNLLKASFSEQVQLDISIRTMNICRHYHFKKKKKIFFSDIF